MPCEGHASIGLSRKRYNKTKKRLVIGAPNVRTLANRTDIMERKEVSKTSDKPIGKVPLLALELEAHHIDVCCLSEVRRESCKFEREGYQFYCSGYRDGRKLHGVGAAIGTKSVEGTVEIHRGSARVMW
jgi:hypothetical protein